MGEVYRARDPRLGREVAIKVLPADSSADPDRLRRFEQEAKAAGALNHPNLLAVFDTGQHEGSPYVVFELLEGETLRAAPGGHGALPPRKAVDYAIQIAHGLAAAHEKGIVHRDLKPENLFVTRDGRVKILDFGLAKLRPPLDPGEAGARDGATASELDRSRARSSAPSATCRRSRSGGSPADHRSDIFSFGSVLYEMLSGRRPFHGRDRRRDDDGDPQGRTRRELAEARSSSRARADREALPREATRRSASSRRVTGVRPGGGPGCRSHETDSAAVARTPRRGRPEAATGRGGGRRSARRLASGDVVAASADDAADRPLHPVDLHRRVGAPRPAHEWLPAIFTDGARIYFTDYSRKPGPGPAYVSRAGGEVVQIPSPVERGQVLGLSPDGGRLLVREWLNPLQTEGALWVVPTSGGAPKRLGDVMAHDAAWSPDGQSLVYARGEELYLSRSDGAQARRLATTPGRAHWIRWSPDGRHLRFTLIDAKGHRRSLWEVSADGTDLHVLPFQWDEERPQECCGEWSRDGRYFVFTAVHEQGAALWMVDETGAVFRGRSWKPRRLTSDSFASVAAIPSVDGKELYAVESRGTAQALRYDPRSRQLAAFPFPNAAVFRFSRDGQWLAYVEFRGTKGTLKRSRLDGSQALELTDRFDGDLDPSLVA